MSFKKAIELKSNFKTVDHYVTDENVIKYFIYEYKPKNESQLTNFIVYDLETYNTTRARPYCVSSYISSKIASKYERNLTLGEYEKSRKETIVFEEYCTTKMLDYLLKSKGQPKKVGNRVVEYEMQMHVYNGSGETFIIFYILTCERRIVDLIRTGKSIISFISLNVCCGYVDEKSVPQYLFFKCGVTDLNFSLKKLGKTFKLQKY